MLERPRRLVASVLVGGMLVAACGSPTSPAPSGTTSPAPSASPVPTASAPASPAPSAAWPTDLNALTRLITSQVEQLRGLTAKTPVSVTVLDEAALIARVKKSFAEDNPADLVAATDAMYTRMGLLGADQSLGDLYVKLLGSQVLGLYDAKAKTLFVVARGADEQIGPLERFTMSHEIDHALQDQNYGLQKLLPDVNDQSDRSMAALSVAEGDATVLMFQWATGHLTQQELLTVIAAAADPEQQAILEAMPPILKDTLQFPYIQGQAFISAAMRSGGWPSVDALYSDPPLSTEQVLHPEKYVAGEKPIAVTIPGDLADRLGSGWKVALQDTMGEYQTSIWLAAAGKQPQGTADAAAAGWGGDRIAYVDGPADSDAVVWRTTWDSAAEADQFAAAAEASRASLPYPTLVAHQSGSTDVTILIASDDATLVTVDAAAGLTGV